MEIIQLVLKEINESKWVKNKLSGSSNIYSKILQIESDLYLLLKSDKSKYPILAKVEAIKTLLNDFCIYYDGELNEYIKEDEYIKIKKYLSENEWQIINGCNYEEKLQENNLFSDYGYYVDIHANYRVNDIGNEKEILKEIKKILNIE